jgi:signal transduction histidine kinase
MTARARSIVAWSGLGLCLAFAAGGGIVAAFYDPGPFDWSGLGFLGAMLSAPAFGAMIVSRAPNRVGWLLLVTGLGGTLAIVLGSIADAAVSFPGLVWVAWVANWTWPFSLGSLILILQLFPDGRPLSSRWRWLLALTFLALGCLVVGGAFGPGPLGDYQQFQNPLGVEAVRPIFAGEENIGWLLLIPAILGSAAAVAVRYRRSRGDQRQQLKWLAYAGSFFGVGWIAIVTTWETPPLALVANVLFAVGILALPAAVGVAILRYRLYDIDVVINKTLVYGALAAFITAVYVAIVVGVGTLVGRGEEPNLVLSIVATAVVALSFQPVRERVQRFANRLVYGERATPYEVMSSFSDRVGGTVSLEDVLPRIAEAAAGGVGAAAARVSVALSGGERRAVWPPDAEDGEFDRTIAVEDRGDPVGAIAVRKPRGEALTPADEQLLQDLAGQAGLALGNVRLTADLERSVDETERLAEALAASRRRILTARDEERRRLERRVHGGPLRRLSGVDDRLREIEQVLTSSPEAATPLLEALGRETTETLDSLRELARGVFPPLLADSGLAAALDAHVRKLNPSPGLTIDPALSNGAVSSQVAATAYFCAVVLLEESDGASRLDAGLEDGRVVLRLAGSVGVDALVRVRDRAEAQGGEVESAPDSVMVAIPVGGAQSPEAAAQASSSRSGSNSDFGM